MLELTSHVERLAAHAGYRLTAADLPAVVRVDPDRVAVVIGASAGTAVIDTLRDLLGEAAEHTGKAIGELSDQPADSPALRHSAGYLSWLLGKAAAQVDRRGGTYHQMLTDALDGLATAGAILPVTEPRQPDEQLREPMAAQLRRLVDECAAAWGHQLDWTTIAQTLGPRLNEVHSLLDAVAGLAAVHVYQRLLAAATPAAHADLDTTIDPDAVAAAAERLAALTDAWADSLHTQATHNHTVITCLAGLAKRCRAWRRERWRPTPPDRTASRSTT